MTRSVVLTEGSTITGARHGIIPIPHNFKGVARASSPCYASGSKPIEKRYHRSVQSFIVPSAPILGLTPPLIWFNSSTSKGRMASSLLTFSFSIPRSTVSFFSVCMFISTFSAVTRFKGRYKGATAQCPCTL